MLSESQLAQVDRKKKLMKSPENPVLAIFGDKRQSWTYILYTSLFLFYKSKPYLIQRDYAFFSVWENIRPKTAFDRHNECIWLGIHHVDEIKPDAWSFPWFILRMTRWSMRNFYEIVYASVLHLLLNLTLCNNVRLVLAFVWKKNYRVSLISKRLVAVLWLTKIET